MFEKMFIPAAEHTTSHYQQSRPSSSVQSEPRCSTAQPEDCSVRLHSTSGTLNETSTVGSHSHQRHPLLSSSFDNDITSVFAGRDGAMESPNAPRPSNPSNNLYDHEDPWHTIGLILGLSPSPQGISPMLAHDVLDTSSASYIPKSLQDDQGNTSICLPSLSLSGGSPTSKFALSTHSSSSPSGLGTSDLRHDEKPRRWILTSPGHSFTYDLAPAFRLSLADQRNTEKAATPVRDSSSSSSHTFSSLQNVSLRDEDQGETFDTEEPEVPVLCEPLALDVKKMLYHLAVFPPLRNVHIA